MSALKLYASYNFVDKDPVIYRVGDILKKEGVTHAQAAKKSGVAYSTFHNWFEGKTRRPQYATVMAVVRALGYKEVFVRKGEKYAVRESAKDTGAKVHRLRGKSQSGERRERRTAA